MTPTDKKYNVDGFCRRTPAPGRPPVTVNGDIIEISSDDDSDSDSDPNRILDSLPLNILQIKREQVVEQLNAINGNDSNEIAENMEYELNQDNAISEPICQNVLNEQNALKTSLKETGAHGYQTPESLGQASSGIGSIVNNYSSDDDFLLDSAGSNNTGNNNTKQQMNNVSTPKVLFSMKSEKKKKDTPRLPLQNFSENVIQNDDTTQMVPDYNGMYSNQDENFSTDNTFADRFGKKSDLYPQNTPTMYSTHSHQPHETSSTNYNENVKTNHSYNADMNNGDSNQYPYRTDNVFFPSNCTTPVYPTLDQPSMQDILKAEFAKIKEEQDQKRNEERDKERDKVIEDVLKKFEDKGLIVVPRNEYEALKKDRATNRENSPHRTTKNGDQSSSKRHSMSPKRYFDGHGPDINSEKRHKSSLHNHRNQASSSSKHTHRHDYQRSSSTSSKFEKSSHKTSTITSGSYHFQNDSNPSAMDYENASSSDSILGSSVKEKTPSASDSGIQFKYKSGFGKDSRFINHSTQQNQSKFGAHQAYKFTETRRSVVKNTDKSLYLNSDKARTCRICHRNYKRMVVHMKTVHTAHEVFVSRISQSMVDMAKQDAIPVIKYIKPKSTQYVKATCLFCEEDKDFMPHYWNDHLRSHTGEWGHECRLCLKNTCFYTHCGHPTSKLVEFNLYVENLCAFVCRKCNYIQLDENNIQKHLKNEHEITNPQSNREYHKIKLLPAMKNIQFSRNPHLDGAHDSSIPRFFGKTTQPQPKQRAHASASVHSLPSTGGIMVLENRVIRPAVDTETASTGEIQQPENENAAIDDIEMQNQNESATIDDQLLVEMPVNDSNNAYKIDAEEENVLWGTYTNYNEISIGYNYEVRPWIDDYAKKPAIHLMTQFALFKCMHPKCLYATDNPQNWEIHMAKHIDMIDVLDKRLNMDKEIRSTHIKYRECPYCQYEAKANFQTIAHMEQTHCRSAFQCEHCFYRSIEMDNMISHYEMHHKDKSRKILLCNDEVEFQQSDEEQLKSYCDQNVEKIKCGQEACSEEFVCFNTFYLHLKVCHPNGDPNKIDTYKCAYCFVDVMCTEQDIQKHLKDHYFNEFHCLYCKIGFDDIDQIRAHMSDHHASHFLFIVARRSPKPEEVEEVEEDIQLVHIGDSKNYRDFSLFKCTNPDALELMKPTVLDVQAQYEVLQTNQNSVNRAQFFGKPPSMKFGKIKDDFFIKYDDYIKLPRHRGSYKSVESTSHSVNQASPAKSTEQIVYDVPPQVKVVSRHPIKSEFNQVNFDQNQFESAVATDTRPTITCKCISIKEAEDLENIKLRSYKAQLCHHCSKFIKIDKKTGLNPYISHLMEENDHPCTEFSPTEKYMIQHRIKAHGDSSIVYIMKEETTNTLVYKLVHCQFQCLVCDAKFENVIAAKKHHQNHLNRYLRSKVIQKILVIQSDDPEQPVDSCTEVTQKYSLCNLFWCNRCNTAMGTRLKALTHHKDSHPRHNFEYSIKSLLVESNTLKIDDHSLYVLECEHCMQLFGSNESVQAHIKRVRNENPNSSENALYTVKQLLVCPECKIVSTYSGLDAHYSANHPEKAILPVHIINNKLCGLCRMNERDARHFQRAHERGEVVGNVLLRKLKLDKELITNCTFAPGCCGEMRFDQIAQVINHVSNCKLRCFCDLCPDSTFTGANEFITHRKDMHNENLQQILDNIHNIKNFMSLLSEMRLIFPNGFVVTKKAIEDTSIGIQLSNEISEPVRDLFDREKLWFNTILLLGP